MAAVNISYLIPQVRLKVGDINAASYRYLDEWILLALVAAVRSLARRWDSKYLITDEGLISRNNEYLDFEFDEDELDTSTIVQEKDEEPIVLKAAIILVEGDLENSAWNLGSWRDAEIYYSNTESGRIRSGLIAGLKEDLDKILKPPSKRLVKGSKAIILEEV